MNECSCPSVKELARSALEGFAVEPCPLHRPQRPEVIAPARPVALNDDQALAAIAGGHLTTGDFE